MFHNFSIGLLALGVVMFGFFVGLDLQNDQKRSIFSKYNLEQRARRLALLGGIAGIIILAPFSLTLVQVVIGLGIITGATWWWWSKAVEFWIHLNPPQYMEDGPRTVGIGPIDFCISTILSVCSVLLAIFVCFLYAWSQTTVEVIGAAYILAGIWLIWYKRKQVLPLHPSAQDYAVFLILLLLFASVDISFREDPQPLYVALERPSPASQASPQPQTTPQASPTPVEEAPAEAIEPQAQPSPEIPEPPQVQPQVGFNTASFETPQESTETLRSVSTELEVQKDETEDVKFLRDVSGAEKHQEALNDFFLYDPPVGQTRQFIVEIEGKFRQGEVEITTRFSGGGGSTHRPGNEGSHTYFQNGTISFFQVKYTGDRKVTFTLSVPTGE